MGGVRSGLRIYLAALLLVILFGRLCSAETVSGKVIGVRDGDTIDVLVDRQPVRIRLAEIDTPERSQPWGSRAKQALSELVFGKEVRVVIIDTDFYGRSVGRVYAGSLYVNAELVRAGHAWVYRQYMRDRSLLSLEEEAKNAGRGLWGLPVAERIPPWEWRVAGRAGIDPRVSAAPPTRAPSVAGREDGKANAEPDLPIQKWQTPSGSLYFGDRPPVGSRKIGEYRAE